MRCWPGRRRSSSTGSSRLERWVSTTVSTFRSSGCRRRSRRRCARRSPEAWMSASRSGRPAGGRTSGSPRRPVLLARPRLRRWRQAGGRDRRRRAGHRRSGEERRPVGPVRDDQRLERSGGARRRSGCGARTDPSRARRGRVEGRSRRHGDTDAAQPDGCAGRGCRRRGGSECRRGDRGSGGGRLRRCRRAGLEGGSPGRRPQRLHPARHGRGGGRGRGDRRRLGRSRGRRGSAFFPARRAS